MQENSDPEKTPGPLDMEGQVIYQTGQDIFEIPSIQRQFTPKNSRADMLHRSIHLQKKLIRKNNTKDASDKKSQQHNKQKPPICCRAQPCT